MSEPLENAIRKIVSFAISEGIAQPLENKPNLVLDICKTTCEDVRVMPKPKTITFRPGEKDRRVIDRLADKLGIKTSQVIKIALRKFAEVENVRAN